MARKAKGRRVKLTAARRKRLSSRSFALPGQRKYPIDTIRRARNALARVAQMVKKGKATRAQQAQVQRAVRRRYPSVGVKGRKKIGRRRR